MKKYTKVWISLISIAVIFAALFVVFNTSYANKLVFKVLFSNKRYAKQIEVKTYVLTQEQVADLFKYPDREPTQFTVDELNEITNKNKNRYVIVRIKNLGNKHAWGVISCKTGLRNPILIGIPSISFTYCNYAICISGIFIAKSDQNIYPVTDYKWLELYTK